MIVFGMLIFVLGIVEIYIMWNNNRKKDIILYLVLFCTALITGFLFLSNPYQVSISSLLLKMMGVNY